MSDDDVELTTPRPTSNLPAYFEERRRHYESDLVATEDRNRVRLQELVSDTVKFHDYYTAQEPDAGKIQALHDSLGLQKNKKRTNWAVIAFAFFHATKKEASDISAICTYMVSEGIKAGDVDDALKERTVYGYLKIAKAAAKRAGTSKRSIKHCKILVSDELDERIKTLGEAHFTLKVSASGGVLTANGIDEVLIPRSEPADTADE